MSNFPNKQQGEIVYDSSIISKNASSIISKNASPDVSQSATEPVYAKVVKGTTISDKGNKAATITQNSQAALTAQKAQNALIMQTRKEQFNALAEKYQD